MLAISGLATILLVLAAILSKRFSPLVALAGIPPLAALFLGFGRETGQLMFDGIVQVAPMAAMFLFAILFFGILSDAGLFNPLVRFIVRASNDHPPRVAVGTAILTSIVHLDGAGATTFLIVIPALLPVYDRIPLPSFADYDRGLPVVWSFCAMVIDEVEIVEVSPRDGLQNEKTIVTTADKVRLIEHAIDAGVRRIEIASFVNPRRVPQMADAEDVCQAIGRREGVTTIGLVLNLHGAERALRTSANELGAVVSASDGFGIANQARSSDDTVEEAMEVIRAAHTADRSAQAVISVAFGCPFEGEVDPRRVAAIARKLATARPREIALGDTIGAATPAQVKHLLQLVRSEVPDIPVRCHFHDTRNMAVANCLAALDSGVSILDASIGGLGGCPFAPGATGNVATEDLIYMLNGAGIRSGVSLDALIETSRWINPLVGARPSKLAQVGAFPDA